MNTWGNRLRISLWGESHGAQVGVVIDGVPAGVPLAESDLEEDLARRRAGSAGTTPRKESDAPHIVSGVYEGRATGAPIAVEFVNENTRSGDYRNLTAHPRPSHADMVAQRITLALVTAGAIAKKILGEEIRFVTEIKEIGGSTDKARFDEIIERARMAQDSVGGVVECRVEGVPMGWGEPFFDSVESLAAHLLFSVPAVKGVEFGSGFEAARMAGSEHNDPILDAAGRTDGNHAGGIVGGISNGNAIVVRAAVKPTASISRGQQTYNFETGRVDELVIKGRHDVCIALRAAVVVEAAMAVALADLKLRA